MGVFKGFDSVDASPLVRRQALASAVVCLMVSFLYFVSEPPFPRAIGSVCLLASIWYFLFYQFFGLVAKHCYLPAGVILSLLGVLSLSFVVHYSGGIVSPFMFLYFCILISESVHGLENPITLPVAVMGYSTVIMGQFLGMIPFQNVWASKIYASPGTTIIMLLGTIALMVMTRYITNLIVKNLKARLERETLEKQNMLRKFAELDSFSQIGLLAHRIAHDLRGPLASISGYVEMRLLADGLPNDEKETLSDLSSTVNHMAVSLGNITRFGRASSGAKEKIDLADFVKHLISIMTLYPDAKQVEFRKNYPAGSDFCVYGVRQDFQQAYFNILKNAVEAVRANAGDKVVEIKILPLAGDMIELAISDNGCGVAPEVLEDLFKKTVTNKPDGTGVGMMITHDMLLKNDVSLEIRNNEDRGVTVTTKLRRFNDNARKTT